MSTQILALILAIFGGAGASLITGWLTRPKTKADAGLAIATGEVAISGDAREWAREFASRAAAAEARAGAAETRASAAEDRADAADQRYDAADQRCDEIERKFDLLVGYTRLLQRELGAVSDHPIQPPPPELIPPL